MNTAFMQTSIRQWTILDGLKVASDESASSSDERRCRSTDMLSRLPSCTRGWTCGGTFDGLAQAQLAAYLDSCWSATASCQAGLEFLPRSVNCQSNPIHHISDRQICPDSAHPGIGLHATQHSVRFEAGDRLAQITRSVLLPVCNVSFSDLRRSRLWVRSEPSQGSHLQETLRLGRVRRFP